MRDYFITQHSEGVREHVSYSYKLIGKHAYPYERVDLYSFKSEGNGGEVEA